MAKIFGKDREIDFAPSNLMSFGKSFSRMGGQPLDESEVWYSLTDLKAFAASDAAYVGMKVVYVDETNNKVYQYSIQLDGSLKEIGVAPIGDDSSITVTAEGLVSLFGFATAKDGMLPVREGGKITWKTLEAIGAGDGNDNTTYEFALNTAKDGIIITPKLNKQPIMSGEGDDATQVTYEIALDVYTTEEADEKFLAKADYTPYDGTELSSRVETIEKDYLKAADKYDDTELTKKVSSLETAVGTTGSGLVKDVADNTAAIATIKDKDVGKSMRTVATEVLADALKGASEDFDTLIEMAQWLNTHSTDAVTMDNRIKANETVLAGIGKDGQPTTVLAAIKAAAYDLPAATAEALGGVKSSVATNQVSVKADGTMEVNRISTDKLVQGTSVLVLNGGSSKVTTA